MDSDELVEPVRRKTLRNGTVDWVSIGEIYSLVNSRAPQEAGQKKRDLVLEVVTSLLADGLVRVGDISTSNFVPWPGTVESIGAKVRSMMQLGTDTDWGYEVWLDNTPAGVDLANALSDDW